MGKEKKRNGPTNAGTYTSVVWAHRGADRKALPPKNIIIISHEPDSDGVTVQCTIGSEVRINTHTTQCRCKGYTEQINCD